jgi:hypothetical protein
VGFLTNYTLVMRFADAVELYARASNLFEYGRRERETAAPLPHSAFRGVFGCRRECISFRGRKARTTSSATRALMMGVQNPSDAAVWKLHVGRLVVPNLATAVAGPGVPLKTSRTPSAGQDVRAGHAKTRSASFPIARSCNAERSRPLQLDTNRGLGHPCQKHLEPLQDHRHRLSNRQSRPTSHSPLSCTPARRPVKSGNETATRHGF